MKKLRKLSGCTYCFSLAEVRVVGFHGESISIDACAQHTARAVDAIRGHTKRRTQS